MDWQQKRVLVTGAGGFLGSHLTESLVARGAKVRALVHYNSRNDWGLLELVPPSIKEDLEVIAGDITDPFGMTRLVTGCDVVFHLAALIGIPYSYVAPAHYVAVNVTGTLNLLEAARTQGVEAFIHTSTSETYGTAEYTPMDENHPLKGQSPYSASKIAADKLVESYHCSFGLPAVTVRPFNAFGPRQSARAVIPAIITQALTKDTIYLGHLGPRRDFTYVSDTVEGFIKAAACPKAIGQVINLGTGRSVSVGELAQAIIAQVGGRKTVSTASERLRPEASEVWQLLSDSSRAREILGWEPQADLQAGLKQTIAYIGDNLNRYKVEIYNL